MKIKPPKNLFTRRISNSNYGAVLLPTKINPSEILPTKYCDHENFYVYSTSYLLQSDTYSNSLQT